MKNRLIQALSLGSTAMYSLMIMIFFYIWQGYTPLLGNDTLIAWATVAVVAMTYLFVQYVDTKVELSPLDAELAKFMSYMPLMAFVSVFTGAFWHVITPSAFQWQAGLVFLVAALIDVLGYSKVLFGKMMSSFVAKPKTAK